MMSACYSTNAKVNRAAVITDEAFMLTYGDGVSDVNIKSLVEFHSSHKKIATVMAAQPPGKFGVLELGENSYVTHFTEKPEGNETWINGGSFIEQSSCWRFCLCV